MEQTNQKLYKKGSYIYIEGDEDVNEIYIIQKGSISLECTNKKAVQFRNKAGPGDIIGFISSLSNRPRMESAITNADTVLIIFSREHFYSLLSKNAEIAVKITNSFADELRAYDDLMFSLQSQNSDLPLEERLFNLGMSYYQRNDQSYTYYIIKRYLQLYPNNKDAKKADKIIKKLEEAGIKNITEPVKSGIHRIFADKQMIFCENEPGDRLYIIKEGKVKILKNQGSSEIMLSVLKKGDIFGELAIVSDKPRNASAISDGKSILIPITRENLIKLLHKSPTILKRIFHAISTRVWFTYIRIESRLYERPLTRIYAFLENKLMEEHIPLTSDRPLILNFGIDELLKMVDLTQESLGRSLDDLLLDNNLNFNFGRIYITSPRNIIAKAKFHKSRDHLVKIDTKAESGESLAQMSRSSAAEESVDIQEKKIPEPENIDSETSRLFDELSDEIFND